MKEHSILKKFPNIHTGRELELMLDGRKPMAWFHDTTVCLPDEQIIPEAKFSGYVDSRDFIRDEMLLKSKYEAIDREVHTIMHVFYALRAEKWRIDAMKVLLSEFNRTERWNETCERMQGSLLGYTKEENDKWCAGRFEKL